MIKFWKARNKCCAISVSNYIECPEAGLGRLRTINSELNDANETSEAAAEAGRASVKFRVNFSK